MKITRLIVKSIVALTLILSQVQATSKTVYYHHDALGSIVASTDEQGEVLWKEEYQPYGEKIDQVGNGDNVKNENWYTGKNYDKELDISYFGARWYDAKQGRFLSIDPVGVDPTNIQSFNRYAYANNNPYRYVDPDGETPVDIIFVAIDAVKLGVAIQSGIGVGSAATDLAISIASLASPIPGAGQAYKASQLINKATKSVPYPGGGYGKLDRVAGRERHHMPANSVSPISRHKGSAIQMDKADHALTSSYGSSNAAKAYRSEIGSLSSRNAMAREIRDVRRIGGTKYNQATREMLDYAKQAGHLNK